MFVNDDNGLFSSLYSFTLLFIGLTRISDKNLFFCLFGFLLNNKNDLVD